MGTWSKLLSKREACLHPLGMTVLFLLCLLLSQSISIPQCCLLCCECHCTLSGDPDHQQLPSAAEVDSLVQLPRAGLLLQTLSHLLLHDLA